VKSRLLYAFVALLSCAALIVTPSARSEELTSIRTTSSSIAIKNLNFLIQRAELQVSAAPHAPPVVAAYLDVLLMRVSLLNTFDDFHRAVQVTEELIRGRPKDPFARIQSARVMQTLHRFSEALVVLNRASGLAKALPEEAQSRLQRELDLQFVTIKLARNEIEQALLLLESLKARGVDPTRLSVLFAAAYRSQGKLEAADQALVNSLKQWDRVTPFTVAWVSFQRGEVWVGVDDSRAQSRYKDALHFLPEYVTASVHLAELKQKSGETKAAIELLKPLAADQDPEPAGRLAEFFAVNGDTRQSQIYRDIALNGWQSLLDAYPLTFADHGAEFWLGAGGDPKLALEWAQKYYQNQPTARAKALLTEAVRAIDALRSEQAE
jgi:tetratricopeptide (TPR) repeat protein